MSSEITKRKINLGNGVWVDATPVSLQTLGENWNEYLANDGSVIRCKFVATQCFRIEGAFDHDGNPMYVVRSNQAMTVDAPESLRQTPPGSMPPPPT